MNIVIIDKINNNKFKKLAKKVFNYFAIFVIIIITFLLIILLFFFNYHYLENRIWKFNDFNNIYPRIKNNIKPRNIKEIFDNRILFIDDSNITNNYIHFLRPIKNKTNTELKKQRNSKIFNEDYLTKRNDQLDFKNFAKLCFKEELINEKEIKKYKINNKPLISVIMPSFNKEKVFLKSLRSIQNQSIKNIEIIIVDDKSTDNSENIYKSILKTDPRIRIFYHTKNMGVWRSRIDGFLYSKGKYVIFFDCGDLYYDNYVLEDMYKLVSEYNLDSVKTVFRTIYTNSYDNFDNIKYDEKQFENLKETEIV